MFKKFFAATILLSAFILSSCKTAVDPTQFPQLEPLKDLSASKTQVDTVEKGMLDSSTKINASTSVIRNTANQIAAAVPAVKANTATIVTEAGNIDAQVLQIQQLSGLLEQAKAGLDIADTKITQEESEIATLTQQRNDAVTARDAALKQKSDQTQVALRWVIVLCVIGGGAGIALCIYGQLTMGIMIAAGSGTTLALAVAVSQYLNQIAIGGLVLLAACVGYLIYQLYLKNKAVKEVVHTTEVAKALMAPEDRLQVFGHGAAPGDAYQIQSSSTEKMVADARKELAPMINHTINDANSQVLDALAEEKNLQATARRRLKAALAARR